MTRSTGKIVVGAALFLSFFFVSGVTGPILGLVGWILILRGILEHRGSRAYKLSRDEKIKARAEIKRLETEETALKQKFFSIPESDPDNQAALQKYRSEYSKLLFRERLFESFLRGTTNISEVREEKLKNNVANAIRALENPITPDHEKGGHEFVRAFCGWELKNLYTIREVLAKNE